MTSRKASVPPDRNTHPRRVPDVRTLPCPSRADLDAGPHALETTTRRGEAVTRCGWCRVGWANLDAELRSNRPTVADTIRT